MAESVRESIEKAAKPQTTVALWMEAIAVYDREFKKWQGRVDKLQKKYRGDDRPSRDGTARFNILWSNVQTLIPATFGRMPAADVSRRFNDTDPVGRVAALILERSTQYEMEHYPDFAATMKQCVLDRFLGGRGTAWARYEPHIKAEKLGQPTDGELVSDVVDEPQEELDYECAPVDYVHWRDFGHTIARTWEEVTAVWRRVYMTRQALIERFGEELGNKVPLDATPEDLRRGTGSGLAASPEMGGISDNASRGVVFEIWDRETKRAIWINKGMPEPLDEKDDPLGLENFWPCPKPLYATLTAETLVPVPDYFLYEDQAISLDTLAERIDGLIQMLQVKGVYDGALGVEVARIFTEGTNGTLIPMKNWAAFAEKNGLAGAIDLVDLKPIYEALNAAYGAATEIKQQIYDITGISDIIRGQSEASETATAQRIKGQYASLRLKSMQEEVARFATELIQLKAQIVCNKFDPKTILTESAASQLKQVDTGFIPLAMDLLLGERARNPDADPGPNPMRNFRIMVDADTMVQLDEQAEKENRNEFITAQGTFAEKALPLIQEAPELAPLVGELWKFSVTAFKAGKTIEGAFDAAIDQLAQKAASPQPPKPDPAQIQAQANTQIEQMRQTYQQQIEQAKGEREMAALQSKSSLENQRLQFEAQADQAKRDHEAAMAQLQAQYQDNFNRWKTEADNQTKIVVAQIAAAASVKTTSISANASAAQDGEGVTTLDGEGTAQPTSALTALLDGIDRNMQSLMNLHQQSIEKITAAVTKPRMVIRGPDERIAGLQ